MKKRLVCLILSILMVVSVVLTTVSCSTDKTDEEAASDIVEEASNNAVTLTMWVVSPNKICNTETELAHYLEDECDNDAESEKYKNMVAITNAYNEVESAFTKITKAKFKANVDLLFYTAEEYYDKLIDAIGTYVEKEMMGDTAAKALKKYQKLAKDKEKEATASKEDADPNNDFDYTYNAKVVEAQFYADHPEYLQFRDSDADDEEETTQAEEETIISAYGISELKYPDTEKDQVDIIYLSGYDKYTDFVNNEWIMDLSEELSGSSKKLTTYISKALMSGVQIDGATYAIPNNVAIGEYTYMMIDKELFDTYYNNLDSIKSLTDCKQFLDEIYKFEDNTILINATYEECMERLVWYWDIDYEQGELNEDKTNEKIEAYKETIKDAKDQAKAKATFETKLSNGDFNVYNYDYTIKKDCDFSVIGTVYPSAEKITRGGVTLAFDSLFPNADYQKTYLAMMDYYYRGYFNPEKPAEGQKCAITFVKGDASILADGTYTDPDTGREYYAIVAEYPQATEEDLYGNMYAVTTYCKDSSRAMKILTELNTSSELRNVLQYGVEDVNYTLHEDDAYIANKAITDASKKENLALIAKPTENNLYEMDIRTTGNEFIAYAPDGSSSNVWLNAKLQNENALIDPLLGFTFNAQLAETDAVLDNETISMILKDKTKEIKAQIDKIDTSYDIKTYVFENGDTMTEKDKLAKLAELKLADLTELVSTLATKLKISKSVSDSAEKEEKKFSKLINNLYVTDNGETVDTSGESPYAVYYNWLTTYGYAAASAVVEN